MHSSRVKKKKDLVEDLAKALNFESGIIEVKSIKFNGNDGIRTRIYTIPARYAKHINEGELIKMDYVMTRLKVLPDILGCYKCHHFGHIANQCKQLMDGKEICWRCGGGDHEMATCKAQVRCLSRVEAKLPLIRPGHMAGSITCPRYKEALGLMISRTRV